MPVPKIVHYCWFGGKEKPKAVQKCLDSWKKYLLGYQIIEWNEQNFDVNALEYTKQAYEAKKYAFVSDVARVTALQQHGGIYMDTDVEVFQSFDAILDHCCILGFEEKNWIATSFMACEPHHPLIDTFIDKYTNLKFHNPNGTFNMTTNVEKLTKILSQKGLVQDGTLQELQDNIIIYPQEYFSSYDYINCVSLKTKNTYCEHKFFVTWLPWNVKAKKTVKKVLVKIIGRNGLNKLRGVDKK